MNFKHAFLFGAYGWAIAEIYDARIQFSIQCSLGEINSIWRKLLVVGAQVCRRKTNLLPEIIAAHDSSQNRVFSAKHCSRFSQIACFHSPPDRCAAYELAVNGHRRNSDDVEVELCAKLLEQFEIAAAILSKRPFMPHTNFAQRFRMLDQLLYELFRLGCSKLLVKRGD